MTAVRTVLSLSPRERATISSIDAGGFDPVTARRLHEMGFDEGVDVELLHRGPIGGDPLAVRVGNMTVALRRSLAAMIAVEPLALAAVEPLAFREAAE
jgi:ferrous iron transport protein A